MTIASTWEPVDLAAVISGLITGNATGPTPTLMPRSDGLRLLYGGELHSLAGEPETGKGWISLAEAARLISNDNRVLYIDFEDCATSIVSRLLALGAQPGDIAEKLVYIEPGDPLKPAQLRDLLQGRQFALAILDGMSEAYALLGLDSYSNTDVPKFLKALPRPIAATGAAVILIDHVTKAKEGRGRWAIGAQHKLAGIAVAYGVEALEHPSRTRAGKLKLTIHKDRHGHIRGHAVNGVIALAHIEPTNDGDSVTVTIKPPDNASEDGQFRPTALMERASLAIEKTPGITVRDLRQAVKGKRAVDTDAAIQVLEREGYIEIRDEGRARRHHSLTAYRRLDDDTPAMCPNVSQRVPDTTLGDVSRVPPLKGDTDTTPTNNSNTNLTVSADDELQRITQKFDGAPS